MKFRQAQCPNCYSGVIVRDAFRPNVFFCKVCFKQIQIKKFKEDIK